MQHAHMCHAPEIDWHRVIPLTITVQHKEGMGLQISQEVPGSARLCAEMARCWTSRSEPARDQDPGSAVKGRQQSHQLQGLRPQVNTKLFPGSSFSKHQNCSIE